MHIGVMAYVQLHNSHSVYAANWKKTSTIYVIKKFVDNKEVYLTRMADGHQNIIRLYGVTTLDGKEKYSLVLEFAKEIASAILWLHDFKGIIHGDLHPNNILIHKDSIKLADFGYKSGVDHALRLHILNGLREEPIQNTNAIFIGLYQKCWEHEPDNRPNIHQVISELNSISPEKNNISTTFTPEESEESEENGKTESLYLSDSD
ncbi:unnamed protein product [Rhizophagus irregularis]|nr:unnamed protein product [Rhizophagus irregularis]